MGPKAARWQRWVAEPKKTGLAGLETSLIRAPKPPQSTTWVPSLSRSTTSAPVPVASATRLSPRAQQVPSMKGPLAAQPLLPETQAGHLG